jgi:hypothetical protein
MCTKVLVGSSPVSQPCFDIGGKPVCVGCAMSCKQMNQKGNFFKNGKGQETSCACAELPGFCLFQERYVLCAEYFEF